MSTIRISSNGVSTATLLAALVTAVVSSAIAQDKTPSHKEEDLIAVLQSDAPKSEKAITCKLLAIHGSSQAVPELAKLLSDPQLASWARIALEAIPGDEADQALRTAAQSLDGKLLIGVIHSIGVRQDANAVPWLSQTLAKSDPAIAAAAAAALGRIGNDAATETLRKALATAPPPVRSVVAEACIVCAEKRQQTGDPAAAIAIYDEVRKADVPQQRLIEATRGAILARGNEGIPLLLESLRSPDKRLFRLALGVIREFPGNRIDQALPATLADAPADRAAMIVYAMADRPDTVDRSALLKAAEQGPKPVRLAAIESLGRVGDASCLSPLLTVAAETDSTLSAAAIEALGRIRDDAIDAQIAERLEKAAPDDLPVLFAIVGERRIDATEPLFAALDHSDPKVRRAALTALGETIKFDDLGRLIDQLVHARSSEDRAAAIQALTTASVRMPDRDACAAALSRAIKKTRDASSQVALLEIIAAVGGETALSVMRNAATSSDERMQDASTRLLGKWMTPDAAPVLLELAENISNNKYRVRALRGYIRIARQFVLPMRQRAEMCRKALAAAWRPAEKQLVMEVLERYPSGIMLNLAIESLRDGEIKDRALQATLVIAQKLAARGADVSRHLKRADIAKVKLEIVKAEYGAGSTRIDVTNVLRKHAGDLPMISLPSSSYNRAFGRDPVPGSVKQLTIHYRMNGREGKATFAEDAAIILPMPK